MLELDEIVNQALSEIESAEDLKLLDNIRVQTLGKKGSVTQLLKSLGSLSQEERPKAGQKINLAKNKIQEKIESKKELLLNQELSKKLKSDYIDVTLPSFGAKIGSLHPVTKTLNRLEKIFQNLGFDCAFGPEIEDDFHNFTALNIPDHHPARAMHDSFYFDNGHVLRTHTSPVQIRAMLNAKPPFRLISTGRVYRCDSDLTHTPMFHQIEGFMVDENISFANLKAILNNFIKTFFEKDLQTRFRPSYFPFTEPSAEVDMECANCNGQRDNIDCRVCKNTGWIEILGCGMVHPNVLENCKVDIKKYTGWAFGIGVDRLAMLRYKIDDLRLMFENDKRFLEQF